MNKFIFATLVIALIALAIILSIYIGSHKTTTREFRTRHDQNVILFGVTPWGEAKQMKEAYTPLLTYLSEKTGKKFQLLILETYHIAIKDMITGSIDISEMSPVSYVKAKFDENNIQYIATITRPVGNQLKDSYHGYIIGSKDKFKDQNFNQVIKNGKKYNFGFVVKSSSSGYVYPMTMFRRNNIEPKDTFKTVSFFDNHPQVTDAIVEGFIDLGATWEYNLEIAQQKHSNVFKILYTTPPIPSLCWAASSHISKDFVKKLQDILLELDQNQELKDKLLENTPAKGWRIRNEHFYDIVKDSVKFVDN
ncbi:phosphate/phosphite/phosphonate ABC transporter substrate-binding protein [bacterium]|nr:phosphate/phosphite/phosphonate ABC transporter substrate-binding protein [bacterium]